MQTLVQVLSKTCAGKTYREYYCGGSSFHKNNSCRSILRLCAHAICEMCIHSAFPRPLQDEYSEEYHHHLAHHPGAYPHLSPPPPPPFPGGGPTAIPIPIPSSSSSSAPDYFGGPRVSSIGAEDTKPSLLQQDSTSSSLPPPPPIHPVS